MIRWDGGTYQKIVLFPKSQEMRKERVEMTLGGDMQEMLKVRVIDVCEYAEELTIDLFGDCWEVGLEVCSHCII